VKPNTIFERLRFRGMFFADDGAGATGGGAATGGGSGTGGGAPASTTPAPAPTGGTGSSAPAPKTTPTAAGGGDENIRQLRETYETTKTNLAAYETHGKPEEVARRTAAFNRAVTHAEALAVEAGYKPDEVRELMEEDPVKVLNHLEKKAAEARAAKAARGGGKGPVDEDKLKELVKSQLEEFHKPEIERRNIEATNAANAKFDTTVSELISETYAGAELTKEERNVLLDATSELLKYDVPGLTALKKEGKTAAIKKHFQNAIAILDKYYLARNAREMSRGAKPGAGKGNGGEPPKPGAEGARNFTLQEMIEDPGKINSKYAEGA
jgi:hypothetical protein